MDDFHDPKPHAAAGKMTVDTVIGNIIAAGNSMLSLLSGLLAAALILYSGLVLYDTFYTQASASNPYGYLQERPVIIEEGAEPLSGAEYIETISRNYRAWLTMYDTNIDYPVMQGKDDYYYAAHDVYDNISLTGSIYMAAANNSDFTDSYNIIYGHHMDNKAMFGGLDEFKDEAYFASHREGTVVASSGTYDLYTFAVVRTDAYETMIYTAGDRMGQVLSFLETVREYPDGKTEVLIFDEEALEGAEAIVALSTCEGANTNGRLIVFAKVTKKNMLVLSVEGYEGIYDNASHGPSNIYVNFTEGTEFSYSPDGGESWIAGLPEIKDVGEMDVIIRARNEIYGEATANVSLKVDPKPVTVKVGDSYKFFGEEDPQWYTEYVSGIIDGFVPSYTIIRTNAGEESVGVYTGVLAAQGETLQGNYVITFLPGTFTISPANSLAVTASGYTGIYDGKPHGPGSITVNVQDGTVIEYSTDGGRTWTSEAPEITDVGTVSVLIRATNPGYTDAMAEITLTVTPAPVTVTASDASKEAGQADPKFTATVEGVIDDFEIVFTVSRPGAGKNEKPGTYTGAIVPYGEALQGNYSVTYVAGDFTISEAENSKGGSKDPFDIFDPRPGTGTPAWALVNLICTIIAAYLFMPLLSLKAKYKRGKAMKEYNREKCALFDGEKLSEDEEKERDLIFRYIRKKNESKEAVTKENVTEDDFSDAVDELYYRIRKFLRRFRTGFCIEALDVAAAIVVFILTEDMRLPMVLIDKWTPLMILFMLICWLADVRLMRYRDGVKADSLEEENEKNE